MVKLAVFFAFLMLASLVALSVNAQGFTDEKGNPCPCATTDDLRPVCGSDGKSYENLSTLDCENKCKRLTIAVKHEGRC